MKSEQKLKNQLIIEIEGLKDQFDEDDLEYMKIDNIRLCQEDSKWGNYDECVRSSMTKIRQLVDILDMSDDDFKKLFDSIKSRWA